MVYGGDDPAGGGAARGDGGAGPRQVATLTAALRVNRNAKFSEETMPPLPAGRFRAAVVDPRWEVAFGQNRGTATG